MTTDADRPGPAPMPEEVAQALHDLRTSVSDTPMRSAQARIDIGLAEHRTAQEWRIFAAQSQRAANEAADAMKRHRESMKAAQAQSDAATKHAKSLTFATWVLAGATVCLIAATIAGAFIARA